MTIYELLESAQYSLNENGKIGAMVAKQQLNKAMEQIENGKELHDEFEEEK